jgi:hypothetical protein
MLNESAQVMASRYVPSDMLKAIQKHKESLTSEQVFNIDWAFTAWGLQCMSRHQIDDETASLCDAMYLVATHVLSDVWGTKAESAKANDWLAQRKWLQARLGANIDRENNDLLPTQQMIEFVQFIRRNPGVTKHQVSNHFELDDGRTHGLLGLIEIHGWATCETKNGETKFYVLGATRLIDPIERMYRGIYAFTT